MSRKIPASGWHGDAGGADYAEEAFLTRMRVCVKVVLDAEGWRFTFPGDTPDRGSLLQKSGNGRYVSSPGIYGYRAGFIRRYVSWQPSPLLEHILKCWSNSVLCSRENWRRCRQSGARHGQTLPTTRARKRNAGR